jgi:hypothetical protein
MANDKQITIKDFKMWLEGVEEMQDENWTPSPTQWKRIREKIDSITETQNTLPQQPRPVQRSMMEPNNFPLPPSNLPVPPQPSPSTINPLFGSPDSGIPAKTPAVDTTDGKPYKSSFT